MPDATILTIWAGVPKGESRLGKCLPGDSRIPVLHKVTVAVQISDHLDLSFPQAKSRIAETGQLILSKLILLIDAGLTADF